MTCALLSARVLHWWAEVVIVSFPPKIGGEAMRFKLFVMSLCIVGGVVQAQQQAGVPAQRLVQSAVVALGGPDAMAAVRTIKIEGYGQTASQNGGGNISADPNAP